MFQLGCNFF